MYHWPKLLISGYLMTGVVCYPLETPPTLRQLVPQIFVLAAPHEICRQLNL